MPVNHETILASRPDGMPTAANFDYREAAMPEAGDGEILIRLIYLSVDPYMRGRMIVSKSYIAPFEVDAPLESGAVGQVVASNNPKYAEGDFVTGMLKWREFQTHSGKELVKLDGKLPLSYALGVLGMPGMTAWAGLNIHGKPKEGETLVVSAASGAVGSLVVQLGKAKGLRVVGVAGGAEKCAFVTDELGADACVDHRDLDLNAKLKAACPDGVDIYFENVGGEVFEAVFPQMNLFSRLVLCGQISQYNATERSAGIGQSLIMGMIGRRMTASGFVIGDHRDRFDEFQAEVGGWIRNGKVRYREDIAQDLERAAGAFQGLLEGRNFGKQLVQISDDPTR